MDQRFSNTTMIYTPRHALSADPIALVDALEIDRATWVGHDWGLRRWSAARHHPERFAAGGSRVRHTTPWRRGSSGCLRCSSVGMLYPEKSSPPSRVDYYQFTAEQFDAALKQSRGRHPEAFFANPPPRRRSRGNSTSCGPRPRYADGEAGSMAVQHRQGNLIPR